MPHYSVAWYIEIDAKSPIAAAKEAWRLMRGKHSQANCFAVTDTKGTLTDVDLEDEESS